MNTPKGLQDPNARNILDIKFVCLDTWVGLNLGIVIQWLPNFINSVLYGVIETTSLKYRYAFGNWQFDIYYNEFILIRSSSLDFSPIFIIWPLCLTSDERLTSYYIWLPFLIIWPLCLTSDERLTSYYTWLPFLIIWPLCLTSDVRLTSYYIWLPFLIIWPLCLTSDERLTSYYTWLPFLIIWPLCLTSDERLTSYYIWLPFLLLISMGLSKIGR